MSPAASASLGGFMQRRLSQDEYITVGICLSFKPERPYNLQVQGG